MLCCAAGVIVPPAAFASNPNLIPNMTIHITASKPLALAIGFLSFTLTSAAYHTAGGNPEFGRRPAARCDASPVLSRFSSMDS